MKTLRLLATLLLVALSTGLYSCGKDDLDREPAARGTGYSGDYAGGNSGCG